MALVRGCYCPLRTSLGGVRMSPRGIPGLVLSCEAVLRSEALWPGSRLCPQGGPRWWEFAGQTDVLTCAWDGSTGSCVLAQARRGGTHHPLRQPITGALTPLWGLRQVNARPSRIPLREAARGPVSFPVPTPARTPDEDSTDAYRPHVLIRSPQAHGSLLIQT